MNDSGFIEIPFFNERNIMAIVVLNTTRINTSKVQLFIVLLNVVTVY